MPLRAASLILITILLRRYRCYARAAVHGVYNNTTLVTPASAGAAMPPLLISAYYADADAVAAAAVVITRALR